jgi:hypothetical protein
MYSSLEGSWKHACIIMMDEYQADIYSPLILYSSFK